MNNPLLNYSQLPPFSCINIEDIEPALDSILKSNRGKIKKLLSQQHYTWQNLMTPLEEIDDRLNRMWSPINHLNSVINSKKLRDVYNKCLSKLAQYHTELGQNETLYQAMNQIHKNKITLKLNAQQKKIIQDELLNFKLSGVTLNEKNKKRYMDISKQLSQLTTKFDENVLDATHAWSLHIKDKNKLSGLPQNIIDAAAQAAKKKKIKGWLFSLDFPIYHAIITYCDDADIRKEMYDAYVTRASELGPNANQFDNAKIMDQIVALNEELASLVGFKNYAEFSLAKKMAKNTNEVFNFLYQLADQSKPSAQKDINYLKRFVNKEFNVSQFNIWDMPYYSEKLRIKKYNISQEQLREYFPENVVINGMFQLVEKLFGISIKEKTNPKVWHKDVKFFEIYNQKNKLIAYFYTDLYARAHKRSGAWMDECRVRRHLLNGKIQLPVAYLTCNFSKPVGKKPSLLTHDEVLTLFHEFGHCLQHLLTTIDFPEISGINGVEWDAVELSSQFMENFCWENEVLDMISCHYETKEKLPNSIRKQLIASKNFHAGLQMIRQLEFSIFDFRIYAEFDPKQPSQIQKILDEVRKKFSVMPIPKYNRFQNSFLHIFGGGYAAGYYSYKWAEVLSSDAYSRFEEEGILNPKVGKAFLHHILEKGGSEPAMKLFVKFRGRKPKIDALLRHCGITKS